MSADECIQCQRGKKNFLLLFCLLTLLFSSVVLRLKHKDASHCSRAVLYSGEESIYWSVLVYRGVGSGDLLFFSFIENDGDRVERTQQ